MTAVAARSRLFDALDELRTRDKPHLSVWSRDGFAPWSWDEWRSMSLRAAAGAGRLGVEPGQPVACVLTNASSVAAGVIGLWLAGATVASLPTPARGMSVDAYLGQLRRMVDQLGADLLLLEGPYAAALPADALPGVRLATFESLLEGPRSGRATLPAVPEPDDVIFVQFSSGSTAEPRGCRLTAGAIEAQLDILAEGLSLDPDCDQGVSWLPLSHDMGMFGCLMLSFVKGMPLALGPPERFLKSPRSWLSDCAALQATITAAPNFALELAAKAAAISPPGYFPMQKCVIGGERVEAGTLARATQALAGSGLTAESLVPAYGLAEAVLAVTMTAVGEEPRILAVDPGELEAGRLKLCEPDDPDATHLVSAGGPLLGVEVNIQGGEVGEICVRSPAAASGYLGDTAATSERFAPDGIRTGDLGFLHDGELYVWGRSDDMLNLGGRNVWARDVEAAVGALAPIRAGSCVLVACHGAGRERLVLLAEPARGAHDLTAVARAAARAARQTAGVVVDDCVLVAPGGLPKTPSGKVARHRCQALAASDALPALARGSE